MWSFSCHIGIIEQVLSKNCLNLISIEHVFTPKKPQKISPSLAVVYCYSLVIIRWSFVISTDHPARRFWNVYLICRIPQSKFDQDGNQISAPLRMCRISMIKKPMNMMRSAIRLMKTVIYSLEQSAMSLTKSTHIGNV